VDDGSIDRSLEVVNAYVKREPRIRIFERPRDRVKGANACRNYGFEFAKGNFVNFFDSDDLMHRDKLKLQMEMLENSKEDFNVCQTLVFKGPYNGNGVLRASLLKTEDPFNDFLAHKIKWLTQAPLIKTNVLHKYEVYFNEDLQQSQELDFFVRLLSHTTSYSIIEKPLVFFRMHEDSTSYGPVTLEKLVSSFNVRYHLLTDFRGRIVPSTRKVILKELIALYCDGLKNTELQNNYYNALFYQCIKKELGSSKQSFLLFLMRFSYLVLSKGDIIKSKLQSSL
jgi:glycosyltransferase involved in cell wall biosynthesis